MTTCLTALNSSFLAFPRNLGVSPGAEVIERQARELQDISDQSVTIGEHLREIIKRLHVAARESRADNWDSYGAKAVDPRSLFRAIRFAHLLTINVPIPDIYVDPNGEIVFEWYFGPRRVFNVTAAKNGELAYAGLFGVNKVCGVVQIDDELPETILDNIFKVSSETGYSCS
jgi:hypothetical protein